jgi:hypothetical protein
VIAISILALLALGVWALGDVVLRPRTAFEAADRSKTLWLVALIVGLFFLGPLGGLLGFGYLVAVRPKVKVAGRTIPSIR